MSDKTCPHCGCPLTKPRSESDHRRFFAVIATAYDQWPEGHAFQPDSAEHLRAWLLCKAGYRQATSIPIEDDAPPGVAKLAVLAAEAAVKAAHSYAFMRLHGNVIVVFSPRSIAFDTLSQKDFGPVRSAVEDVIVAETGLEIEALLRNAREHAA